jgi:hypothetical protein
MGERSLELDALAGDAIELEGSEEEEFVISTLKSGWMWIYVRMSQI